jgi:uncharacterized protein
VSILEQISGHLKDAMKSGDKTRLGVLRMVRSKMQEAEVERRAKAGREYTLGDEEAVAVIAAYAKQRHASIDSYRKAGREDLVAQEEAELAIVQEYLPEQLSDEALREIVREAIESCGAKSPKDMGAVMKQVMPKIQGAADGKAVSQLVREMLS